MEGKAPIYTVLDLYQIKVENLKEEVTVEELLLGEFPMITTSICLM